MRQNLHDSWTSIYLFFVHIHVCPNNWYFVWVEARCGIYPKTYNFFFCFSSLPLYSIHHLIQVQKWWWHGQIYNKAWNWFIKLSALSLHLSTSFLSIGCAVELCYVFQNGCPQTETGWTMHYGKGFGLFTGDQISGLCEQPLASRLFFFVCGTRESNIILWETNSWLIYGSFASSARVKVLW